MDNGNYLWFSHEMKLFMDFHLFMRVRKCTWFSETQHGFQNHEQNTKKENLFLKCKITEKFSSTWFSIGDVVF